jgi:hypothetical protein
MTVLAAVMLTFAVGILVFFSSSTLTGQNGTQDPAVANAQRLITQGRETFRSDTFGDEAFWGGQLHLHEAINGVGLGGVGTGLTPRAALQLGLKVDIDALSGQDAARVRNGRIDLDSVATTMSLLRSKAVVGITGFFNGSGDRLISIGIQCALCHSTVNDSVTPALDSVSMDWPIVT